MKITNLLLMTVAVAGASAPVTVQAGTTDWQTLKKAVAEVQSLADRQAPDGSSTEHAIKWTMVEPLILAQWQNCKTLANDEFDMEECKAGRKSLLAKARKLLGRNLVYSSWLSEGRLGKFNFKTKKYPVILRPAGFGPMPSPCESAVAADVWICLFRGKRPSRALIRGTVFMGGGMSEVLYWYFEAKPLITYTPAFADTETAKSFKSAFSQGTTSADLFFRWSNPRNRNCAKPTMRKGRQIKAHCWGKVEVIKIDVNWPFDARKYIETTSEAEKARTKSENSHEKMLDFED